MAALLAGAVWLVLATTNAAAHMEAAVMPGFLWMRWLARSWSPPGAARSWL